MTAFEKNGLKIVFSFQRPNPADLSSVTVTLKASNANVAAISDFIFQAAVPKVSWSIIIGRFESCNVSAVQGSGSIMHQLPVSKLQIYTEVLLMMGFAFSFSQAFQLQMLSPTGSTVPPGNAGTLTQVMNVINPQKVSRMSTTQA